MNDKQYTQEGGENSENYQAASNITVNRVGLTFTEAKDLIMLVTQQNFIKFSEEATQIALARMEKLVIDYLDGINAKEPSLIEAVKEPGMQMALVAAQKEYVRTGDENLASLLTNVLIERTAQPQRTILQITLDESITVIGKLTIRQIDTMILSFIIVNMRLAINNIETMKAKFESHLVILANRAVRSHSAYEHIAACGCGNIATSKAPLAAVLASNYKGLFSTGNTKKHLREIISEFANFDYLSDNGFIIECVNNPEMLQLGFIDENAIIMKSIEYNLDSKATNGLKTIFLDSIMHETEIQKSLVALIPGMSIVFRLWENTALGGLHLNNIGKAIAITAYRLEFNQPLAYDIWIDD